MLGHELASSLTDVDQGFIYTFKALTLRPRSTIAGYLAGQRVQLSSPLQYALIGVTLLTLVDWQFGRSISIDPPAGMEDTQTYSYGYRYGTFLKEHIKFLWLLMVLYLGLPNFLFFRKYNFAEHLAISAYIVGHTALITVLVFPLVRVAIIFHPILLVSILLMECFVFWQSSRPAETIVQAGLAFFLGYLLFFLTPLPFHWLIGQIG